MRNLAPTPDSARAETIVDGYQLCARCGNALVAGEITVVVPRSPSWLIYTHAHRCSRNAVRGWSAIRRAEGIRDAENTPTPRAASERCLKHLGSVRPCVCLLDDKHIEAELDLVTFNWSDEWTTTTGDIRAVLELRMRRDYACGYRCTIPSEDAHYDPVGADSNQEVDRSPIVRNYVEDSLIAALDSGGLEWLDWVSQQIQELRAETYATGRVFTGSEETGRAMSIFREPRPTRPRPRRDPIPFNAERLADESRLREAREKQLLAACRPRPRPELCWPPLRKDRPDLYVMEHPETGENGPVWGFNPVLLALLQTRPALLRLNLAWLDAALAPLGHERCEIARFVPETYGEEGPAALSLGISRRIQSARLILALHSPFLAES